MVFEGRICGNAAMCIAVEWCWGMHTHSGLGKKWLALGANSI